MQSVNNVDISIIILSYKSKKHLEVLLPSIFASTGITFDLEKNEKHYSQYSCEVIVVDNDSGDGTAEFVENWLPTKNTGRSFSQSSLRLFRNINNGFSKGNNLGIKQSHGRYILILNPDTKLSPDTLQTMIEFMEAHPDVGISGCKLVKADDTLDLACRRRFPNIRKIGRAHV